MDFDLSDLKMIILSLVVSVAIIGLWYFWVLYG